HIPQRLLLLLLGIERTAARVTEPALASADSPGTLYRHLAAQRRVRAQWEHATRGGWCADRLRGRPEDGRSTRSLGTLNEAVSPPWRDDGRESKGGRNLPIEWP